MSRAIALAISTALLASTAPAHAALIDRGGGMIYDDVLGITWLADWNYARTSGHDADGRMDWAAANAWANNLDYAGFDDWRLPAIAQPDATCDMSIAGPPPVDLGYGCTGSEMGHMFYVNWGATTGQTFAIGTNAANLALFENVELGAYWYRDAWVPTTAWYLQTIDGGQFGAGQGTEFFAVAVRNGDVGAVATPVSAPASLALVLGGLAGLASVRGRTARR